MIEITVAELSRKLSEQTRAVCSMLLPGGREKKGEWVCGDLSGSDGESMKVTLDGTHAGSWRDWASDDHGDMVDLWAATRSLAPAEAIRQVKQWLGIFEVRVESERAYIRPSENGTKPLAEEGEAMKFLIGTRKLDPFVISRFGVEGAPSKRAIVFPCFSPDGALVNRSYRTLPKPGEKKQVWQDKGCAPCLFGWNALDKSAYENRTVLLCEGQIDCMTWAQWGVPALSIPNGSGQTWIAYEWENLAVFDRIYISFDMDGAGAENAQKTIQRLGKHRCFIVKIPHNDANEGLMAGATSADAQYWIESARPPSVTGLVLAADLKARVLRSMQPRDECFTLPFLRLGDGDGYYPRPGEVTVWTGQTSQGKTSFLNYFMVSMIAATGCGVFVASMEMKVEGVIKSMIATFMNRIPTETDVEEFMAEAGHLLAFADVVGYISEEQLFEMMVFCQRRYGVTQCLIDSLMRVDGLEEEYVKQGKFLNRLQEFAKETGTHVHLVAHPRKMNEDGKPGKMDVKGSSLIPNNADNIVSVSRNYEKSKMLKEGSTDRAALDKMHDTEIRVEKQRETGWEGRFLLRYNRRTSAFSVF